MPDGGGRTRAGRPISKAGPEGSPRVYSPDFFEAFWGSGRAREFPPLDVFEEEGRYVVVAELPGLRREDLTVELADGVLTLRGEKRCEDAARRVRQRLAERHFGPFARGVALPLDADPERVQALLADGVLTVSIARRTPRPPRAVEIVGA